jgi:uncharacterized protein (TIGR02246 family)
MPLTMRGIAIVAAWGILVATPGWAQGTPPVKELNKKWMAAFEEGNAHALAAMYTDDAYILPPSGRMVQGTNAILDFWREQTQEFKNANLTPISTKSFGPTVVVEVGTLYFETKARTFGTNQDAPEKKFVGNYVALWRKVGQHWKLAVDIWNTSE